MSSWEHLSRDCNEKRKKIDLFHGICTSRSDAITFEEVADNVTALFPRVNSMRLFDYISKSACTDFSTRFRKVKYDPKFDIIQNLSEFALMEINVRNNWLAKHPNDIDLIQQFSKIDEDVLREAFHVMNYTDAKFEDLKEFLTRIRVQHSVPSIYDTKGSKPIDERRYKITVLETLDENYGQEMAAEQ